MLCDQLVIDRDSGKPTVVGVFTSLVSSQFPSTPRPFDVFAMLTDGQGRVTLDLVVSRLDADERIGANSIEQNFPGRKGVNRGSSALPAAIFLPLRGGSFARQSSECVCRLHFFPARCPLVVVRSVSPVVGKTRCWPDGPATLLGEASMAFDYTIKGWPATVTLGGIEFRLTAAGANDNDLHYRTKDGDGVYLSGTDKEGPGRWRLQRSRFHVLISDAEGDLYNDVFLYQSEYNMQGQRQGGDAYMQELADGMAQDFVSAVARAINARLVAFVPAAARAAVAPSSASSASSASAAK
jgi:hypothetical protein